MNEPDFLICIECESPCYSFEWSDRHDKCTGAICQVCGNESLDQFETEEEFCGEE